VEGVPACDGFGGAEKAGDIDVGDVEAAFQQGDVGLGFVTEEPCPPHPGRARGGLARRHNPAFQTVDGKVVPDVAMEGGLCAGPRGVGRGGRGGLGGEREAEAGGDEEGGGG